MIYLLQVQHSYISCDTLKVVHHLASRALNAFDICLRFATYNEVIKIIARAYNIYFNKCFNLRTDVITLYIHLIHFYVDNKNEDFIGKLYSLKAGLEFCYQLLIIQHRFIVLLCALQTVG